MEESNQQHQLFLQMQQQQQMQQRQQQLFLMQHLQRQQQQQQQQAAAMSRLPSNTTNNSHLLAPPGLIQNRPVNPSFLNPNQRPMMMMMMTQPQPQQQQQEKKPPMMRALNQTELQFAYQDAWRVCHPDFKRPFASLEDACERLLPYHVVADYEAEEDEMILHSDTTTPTSQTVSRSQQWDDNIAEKVGEFTETFEKQVEAFNAITQKRRGGELRTEERLVVEQLLLVDERNACIEVKSELDREMKAHEARLRMAAMAQAGQVMGHNPLRGNAFGNFGEQQQQQQGRYMNPDEMMMRMRGFMNSNNSQREDKEPVEDFLNDEETGRHGNWRGNGEFDLNTR
ncbi:mediator of RNA polymerase II transcription subunit 9-like [Raphanus sativus]|uniref:Mediator of RNA polymerase II transcription subunit 9 n=1 Tax=Raphanus sativus TaxID=3726 RepID=A0A6J0JVX0_RAPSA|nr:mediator of RNA polymerase II transcription subunit 9 [Raphanus sativus]XP_056856480.1 mediator of RNA polymerase II transcription subunit 9-like [Raphanus sativus]